MIKKPFEGEPDNRPERELAETINVGAGTISKWECGRGLPELVNILPLCEVLEITIEELLNGEAKKK